MDIQASGQRSGGNSADRLGGTVYVTSERDDVFALDAKTGEVKWQYRPNARQQVGFPRNRGVAIYDGMVFIGMIDGHIAALDAKTGREI